MSQENINTTRALHDAFTTRNLEQASALVADDFEWKIVAFGMTLNGREGFRQGFEAFANPFPGAQLNYKNVVDGSNQVVVEYDFVGTHTGTLMTPTGPIPATGRPVHIPGIEVFRLRDGKIISLHTYFDSARMLAQLGLMPQPA
jgi:steroid delta-isomerase-like uncharacterized protein